MSIGSTIKKLRRERNITQEQLADYLGITSRAVSQWECDRTSPDISQLPPLANIFEVSTDVLLEIDTRKKEKAIQDFLKEYDNLHNQGKLEEAFKITEEMYNKYPNDYRVIEKYIYELFNDPAYPNEPLGEEVHKEELYRLCNNILDYCTEQKIRYSAMDILSALYLNDGMTDKAMNLCEQFPDSIYDTKSEQYEQMYLRCDNVKYIEYIKKNIRYTTEHLINKIRNFGTFTPQSMDEKIAAYKKCITILETVYESGDYGFDCYHMGHINCLIATLYYDMNNHNNGARFFLSGLNYCLKYDNLPRKVHYTSLLLKDDFEDMSEVYSTIDSSRVAYEIREFYEHAKGKIIPDEYKKILAKFE